MKSGGEPFIIIVITINKVIWVQHAFFGYIHTYMYTNKYIWTYAVSTPFIQVFSPTHSSILLGACPSEWRNVDTKTNGTTRHVKRKNEKKKSPERGNEPKAATIKRIQTQSRPLGYRKTRKKSLKITNAKPTTTRKWHKQINGDL